MHALEPKTRKSCVEERVGIRAEARNVTDLRSETCGPTAARANALVRQTRRAKDYLLRR